MKRTRVYIGLLCFVVLANSLHSQVDPKAIIVGKVADAETGEGLPNVNVFLDGTTLGVGSDKDGFFIIRNVPRGAYELVVSMVGYERQVINLQMFEVKDREISVKLKSQAIQTATIEVTAKDPIKWRRNLERFQKEFLGETRNAKECMILNPEVLEFRTEPDENVFIAFSTMPLKVENHALGYHMTFYWQEFRLEKGILEFKAFTKLEELSATSEDERRRWLDNRKKSYIGSRQHFLSSIARGTFRDEGFEVFSMESFDRSERVIERSQRVEDVTPYVKDTDEVSQKNLSFENYWQVVFKREPPDQNYRFAFHHQDIRTKWQISWITADSMPIIFYTSGELENPYALIVYGYWAFRRIAEFLPLDYESS